ncbi:DNA-binding response regulator [Clostridium baratii]|uniref:Stage 0 sporulation protein A homolog n=3 Tax=Clostridium TaxID=1485 RepID=A0A0A7G1I5_9CLOT|nr:response regulator transcription factor [Clostridium baratii]AIY84855.1 response regulator [Clostridium baratii str. Sullivan]AQM60947.1 DNA-binding response regulator [Clostridium baratii]KJU72257.1 XRE family transcriptional regulator [Clostridium baratii]MBS6007066.1 response regulator transcription factor [Clostridium baratii]MBS6041110.1 response regulator transcription factor [Clostridium baratii]
MNILVVDDEISILQLIKMNLKLQNYNVVTATCGNEALELTIKEKPDIIILDAMLPDISGFELIHKIKLIDDIPIIMLTAKDDINDKLLGLQLGAEDYITKPFNSTELLLRIKVISKRINKFSKKTDKTLSLGRITIIADERKVLVDNEYVDLTFKEFEVLNCLCENKGIVFSREDLLNKVWGYDFEGTTRAVDILIQRLRKKLGPCQTYIKTLYKAGYKFDL